MRGMVYHSNILSTKVFYSYERGFTIAAIEVATIMLLEVSYGWSSELCGVAFIVIAGGSIFMTVAAALAISMKPCS